MKRAVALLGADEVADIMQKEGKIEASAWLLTSMLRSTRMCLGGARACIACLSQAGLCCVHAGVMRILPRDVPVWRERGAGSTDDRTGLGSVAPLYNTCQAVRAFLPVGAGNA